jgi:hypothetical protein
MHSAKSKTTPSFDSRSSRCRLVFNGDTDRNLPREIVMERLRRLFKDSPDRFAQRMARMPVVLLSDTDEATAKGYQRLLSQKGIICHLEGCHGPSPESPSALLKRAGGEEKASSKAGFFPKPVAAHPGAGKRPRAASCVSLNLAVDLCLNPRGTIGRVLSTASYRATLLLAAGVGLSQIGSVASDGLRGDALRALLTISGIVVFGPVIGIVLVYVRGFLLHSAGRLLRGKAVRREVRVALAWSEIPFLLGGLAALLQMAMALSGLPVVAEGIAPGLPAMLGQAGFGMIQVSLGFWALTLLVYTLAEIQGFSLRRSFASIVLATFFVLVPLALVGGLLVGAGLLPMH